MSAPVSDAALLTAREIIRRYPQTTGAREDGLRSAIQAALAAAEAKGREEGMQASLMLLSEAKVSVSLNAMLTETFERGTQKGREAMAREIAEEMKVEANEYEGSPLAQHAPRATRQRVDVTRDWAARIESRR